MKWNPDTTRLQISHANGELVDLSQYVRDVTIDEATVESMADLIAGLKYVEGTITLHGRWDQVECPLCGLWFTPSETMPVPHVSFNDGSSLPCCDACAIQYLTEET